MGMGWTDTDGVGMDRSYFFLRDIGFMWDHSLVSSCRVPGVSMLMVVALGSPRFLRGYVGLLVQQRVQVEPDIHVCTLNASDGD